MAKQTGKSSPKSSSKPSTPNPQPVASEGGQTNWQLWVPVALAAFVFATGLGNQMLGVDDHAATVENPAVAEFSLSTLFSQFNLGMYAPLTWFFYALANQIGGGSPLPFHFLSLIVHVANTYLVFNLLQRLTGRDAVAFAVTVLFAVHPIQVESVAWIAGFSTPLFSLFCLLAALQYLKHSGSEEGNWAAYGLALLAFVAGCLSKSAAVVLAPTLVLLDLWRPAALPLRTRLVGYLPFFALALGFGLLTIYSREASNMAVGNASNGFTVLDRLLLVTFTPVFYWYKLLAPLSLNIYYSFDKMSGALPTYYFAAPVVVAAAGLLAWRFRHSAPWLGWGLLFFFVNISVTLPFASLSTFELRADHYNYLACIGIFYLLVEGWMALQQRFPTQAGLIKNLGRAWVVLLVVLCLMQVRVWKDTVSVLTNAIDNGYYQRGMMYFARGVEYGDLGKPQAAMADFNSALAIDPEMRDAYKFRGSLQANAGQIDLAVQDFEKYLSYDPADAVTWNNMGEIYFRRNQLNKALEAFTKAIEIKPDAAISYQKRSKIYELMGDGARAEADLNKAKELAQIRRDNKAGK